jgi:hypothetical protein
MIEEHPGRFFESWIKMVAKSEYERDFRHQVFVMNRYSRAYEYSLEAVSIFFLENSRRYLRMVVYHRRLILPMNFQWSPVSWTGLFVAGAWDIAFLVWISFGGLGALESGCVGCLWTRFFMAVQMKLSAAVSDFGGRRFWFWQPQEPQGPLIRLCEVYMDESFSWWFQWHYQQ